MQGGDPRQWSLREFKLRKACECGKGKKGKDKEKGKEKDKESCTLTFDRDTDKTNPFGPLFSETSTHPEARSFKKAFVKQVENLAATDLADISMEVDDRFNSAQSQASGSVETNYLGNFEDGGDFADDIEDRLDRIKSNLEPMDIVERAQTQSCAGCHRLSNNVDLGNGMIWPASLGFTHVTEAAPETVDGITRFRISATLTTLLLPQRKEVMLDFLQEKHRKRRGYCSGH